MKKVLLAFSGLAAAAVLAACQPNPSQVRTTVTPVIPVTGLTQLADSTQMPEPTRLVSPTATPSLPPSVAVQDQEIKNGSVVIDKVFTPETGWMAIHADENGAPGVVVGYTGLHAGENDNLMVSVDITRATSSLYAILHIDRGRIGAYEYPGPDQPLVLNDLLVGQKFNASLAGTTTPLPGSLENGANTYRAPVRGTPQPTSGPIEINLGNGSGLVNFLVDGSGRTLYQFKKDSTNTSTCAGTCADIWPPVLTVGDPLAGPGVPGALGTIPLLGGGRQVTYKGLPLYYYAADTQPGDTRGQGVGQVWQVVAP